MGVDDPGNGVGGGNVAGGVRLTSVPVGVGLSRGGGVVTVVVGISVGGGSVSVGGGGSVGVMVVGIGVSVGWGGVAVGRAFVFTFSPTFIDPGSPFAVKITW